MPQGSVLGPLLFLVYINDMPAATKSTLRLFADDSLLYRRVKTPQDAEILQVDLDALQRWETTWQMAFNPSKCEIISITRKKKPLQTAYTIHGHTLNKVKKGKYLGVTIAENLS